MSPTNSSCIVGGYPLYHNSLVHENNINKLSKIMFGLINMADYYCTFDNIDDILCQIKLFWQCVSVSSWLQSLVTRPDVMINTGWKGPCVFPAHIPTKPAYHPSTSHCTNESGKKKRTRLSKEVIWGRIYGSCHGPCFGKHRDELANAREVTPCAWAFSVE